MFLCNTRIHYLWPADQCRQLCLDRGSAVASALWAVIAIRSGLPYAASAALGPKLASS